MPVSRKRKKKPDKQKPQELQLNLNQMFTISEFLDQAEAKLIREEAEKSE